MGSQVKLLTKFLGILWLIDGVLQIQPKMFTDFFIANVLKPNLIGEPKIIASIISFGIHLFSLNSKAENLFFALIQIFIGTTLLLPISWKIKKIALWISIPWCIIVWVFGEGFGALFVGSASFYSGAPGSVLLYGILALFLLFPKKLKSAYLPRVAGFIIFLGGILQEFPMFWMKGMQGMIWQMSQQDSISLISSPAQWLTVHAMSLSTNIIATSILVVLGIFLMLKPTKLLAIMTIIFLFFVWWIGQDFGGIFTFPFGTATDPNSAPILMLFLLPFFFTKDNKEEVS